MSMSVDDPSVFRALFAAYPDALLLVDDAGLIRLANPAAAALLGYSVAELTGLPVDTLVPDAVRPRHAELRGVYARSPRSRPMGSQMDLSARRRDGSEVMVEIALSPLPVDGAPFVVAAVRGIGAYPRVRQALQRARYSEAVAQMGRLAVDLRDPQALLEQVPQVAVEALGAQCGLVFLLERDGRMLRLASGVGLLPGEKVGQRLPNRADTPAGYVLAQGAPVIVEDYTRETRFQVPDSYHAAGLVGGMAVPLSDRGRTVGALAVRSRVAPSFGDEELRFLGSLSSLLATSLQRAQTEEQLSHAQRLESVGQLTGGIAHDFNNLLTVISGNLQVLEDLEAVAADPLAQQTLAAASRASRRAAELTGKLLAFSRRQVLQPSPVQVPALLLSLADMLRRTLDQRIVIRVDAPADCPPCLADPGQLESALLNVAINARDAMPDGGTLSFRGRPCRGLPADLQGDAADASGAYVEITITDTGAGMPEAVKERAFEPFFTTKEVGRGTGLGLSTVYGFAKQSRGAVRLDSQPGQGTTVALYLPQVRVAAAAETEDPATVGLPPGLQVLLVEDDAEVRQVVLNFLHTLGAAPTPCANAEQALLVLDGGAPVDLLLTDVALGSGLRGTELARRARQRRAGLPVLLMSGFSADLIEAPPDAELLRKPYTRHQLALAMARALQAARG